MSRPTIPTAMARAIRHRCGYGCIICGAPIYEYHHINGFDPQVGHIKSEITLLCCNCHRKEQNGLIPRSEILRFDAAPSNRTSGQSKPERVWYAQGQSRVTLGSCGVNVHPIEGMVFYPLLLDGYGVLKLHLENGVWLLTMKICDTAENAYIEIIDNQLTYRIDSCDIEYTGGRLTLRLGGSVIFEASFKSPELRITTAVFFLNGIFVDITPDRVALLNPGCQASYAGVNTAYIPVAFSFGRDPEARAAMIATGVHTRLTLGVEGEMQEVDESDFLIAREQRENG